MSLTPLRKDNDFQDCISSGFLLFAAFGAFKEEMSTADKASQLWKT